MRALFALSAALAAAGCGPDGPRMCQVSGTVLFDGAPVPEGDIVFEPEEKELGPDAGKIKDGKYQFMVKEGKKKVWINASKQVPVRNRRGGDADLFTPVDYIPARYNDNTELRADVVHRQPNQFDFQLLPQK